MRRADRTELNFIDQLFGQSGGLQRSRWALLRRIALVAAVSLASDLACAAMYREVVSSPTVNHTLTQRYFDDKLEAQQSCFQQVENLGFPVGYCHLGGGGTGSESYGAYGAGWLQVDSTFLAFTNYYCSTAGSRFETSVDACRSRVQVNHDKPLDRGVCFGNPIYPLTGSRRNSVEMGRWLGQSLMLVYDTKPMTPANAPESVFDVPGMASFGQLWSSSLHKKLVIYGGPRQSIQAGRGAGVWVSFVKSTSGVFVADTDIRDQVVQSGSNWRYYDKSANSIETYDSKGKLLTVSYADGRLLTYGYSTTSTPPTEAPAADLLIGIQDRFGRSIQFRYEQPADQFKPPRIYQAIGPDGRAIGFGYDAGGNLETVTWQDLRTQTFLYERSDLPWALTGVTDERGVRVSTFGYDAVGRATSTERAGGVNAYSVQYGTAPSRVVEEAYSETDGLIWSVQRWNQPEGIVLTMPNGQTATLGASDVLGMPSLASQSQPAGSGCAQSTSSVGYDVAGNVAWRNDFNGNRTCFAYVAGRNLEQVRVEGLPANQDCAAVLPDGAALPTGSRKITTEWHDAWRLKTKVAEPERRTTYVYNGVADPFNGNTMELCATDDPKMSDGTRLALLCREVVEPTTDMNGAAGMAAVADAAVERREQRWTYYQDGQIFTVDGPRTDVPDVTTFEYYTETAIGTEPNAEGQWKGDLKLERNALGKELHFTLYNRSGSLIEQIDANAVSTRHSYDERQRRLSTTIGGQATGYSYYPSGQLKRVTQPDGATYIEYEYDDAQWLKAVTDNLGNRIEYTLDNFGNRTAEVAKDPTGSLRRMINRNIDALGRVELTTGRE